MTGQAPAGEWRLEARCATVDPEAFFPEKGTSNRPAKAICGRCHVTVECLAFAMDRGITWGIWGGTSPRDRMRLSRERAA